MLRYAPVTNTLISPLLLIGLALALKQWKRYAPLYLLAANGILVMLLTFPTGRYRAAYFAVLIPFAGAVVAQALTWIASRQFKKLLVLASALLVVSIWTSLPLPASRPLIRTAYYLAPFEYCWSPLLEAAIRRTDWREASRVVDQSIRSEPPDLGAGSDPELIRTFSSAHAMLSEYLGKAGDPSAASRELARAREIFGLLPH